MEQLTISDLDEDPLFVMQWKADSPRAIVQIAHGAAEHLGRYDRLARFLGRQGYWVLGADHRGHGINALTHGLGNFGPRGFAGILADMRRVTEAAHAQHPDLPIILLGHSFGSFAAQMYVMQQAELIDGLILSGTAAVDRLLTGAELTSGMASANAAFEPARTSFDWLSRDESEVDAYVDDPLCGFELAPDSLATMVRFVMEPEHERNMGLAVAKNLPVYVISGECDPIVGSDQYLSRALVERYIASGLRDVQHRIYPGGRHEMFNEINRDAVMQDLADWLNSHF
jgi:alpha-beta hydrolase superfamily lysophospholipase